MPGEVASEPAAEHRMPVPVRAASVAVIGACGNTGRGICRLLASRGDVRLTIAGRSATRLAHLASELQRRATHSIGVLRPDVERAIEVPAGVDLVVNASSVTALAPAIARAAIVAGADAFDTNLSSPGKWSGLRALSPAIEAAGRSVVTDCGLHPGVPGALVRWLAAEGLQLRSAQVGGAFALDWSSLEFSDAAVEDFANELTTMDPSALVAGTWRRSFALQRRIDFGALIGRRTCTPMLMGEIRELPDAMPTLQDAGFYVAGFGWAVDYLAMPACTLLARAGGKARMLAGRMALAALRGWTGPDRYAVVLLDANGSTAVGDVRHVRVRVAADDAYALTSACVVASVEQWLDGRRLPGLWTQAAYVMPGAFFRRIGELGATVSVTSAAAGFPGD